MIKDKNDKKFVEKASDEICKILSNNWIHKYWYLLWWPWTSDFPSLQVFLSVAWIYQRTHRGLNEIIHVSAH